MLLIPMKPRLAILVVVVLSTKMMLLVSSSLFCFCRSKTSPSWDLKRAEGETTSVLRNEEQTISNVLVTRWLKSGDRCGDLDSNSYTANLVFGAAHPKFWRVLFLIDDWGSRETMNMSIVCCWAPKYLQSHGLFSPALFQDRLITLLSCVSVIAMVVGEWVECRVSNVGNV